jgi:hypothetical protein
MDNKSLGENEQKNPNADILGKREKILQPSASSVEQIQAAREAEPQLPPNQPAQSAISTTKISRPDQYPGQNTSLYPEATKGIGTPITQTADITASPTPSTEKSSVDGQIAMELLFVRIVASFIVIINLGNAYNWVLARRAGYSSWINIIEIIVLLFLAIRIFRLSESARSLYVLIASFLLILSFVSVSLFYVDNHKITTASSDHNVSSLTKSQLQNGIVAAEHNPRLDQEQKQQMISLIQAQLTNDSRSPVDVKAKEYLAEVLLIITTVGPIIFLTRPSIKSIFS